MTALGRGLGQGATAGFGDEAGGLVQMLTGGGGYQANRDAFRQENAAAAKEWPTLSMLGNVVGGVPLAIASAGKGKGLGALLKTGAILGGATGLGGSEADLTRGELGRAGLDTGLSTLFGMGGAGLGHGAEKLVGAGARWLATKAANKAAQATEKIAQLAKESVDKVTQQARSAAGTAATAAYKNATNIEEAIKAGAMALDDLTPEQLSLYRGLLRERAEKGAQQMAKDAGTKTAKGAEYADVLASVPGRLAAATERIGNPMEQIMPRLKRYAIPAIAGAAGSYFGGPVGFGLGAAAGRGISPGVLAMLRMTRHPAVQRPIWNTLGGLARGVGYSSQAAPALGGQSGRALAPEVEEALMPMLLAAMGQQQDPALATLGGGR
jgi:hypothetical protein